MKTRLRRLFLSCLVFTACFFWLSHGSKLEGLNEYTALSFFAGLLSGVSWGMYLSAYVRYEIVKAAALGE